MFYHLEQHRLSEDQARLYFCEILLVFEYLHQKKIIYRDLKVHV
jgi:serum/glucocorticoid-regulated kinase 2